MARPTGGVSSVSEAEGGLWCNYLTTSYICLGRSPAVVQEGHDKNDRNDNDFQGGMHALPVARSREPVVVLLTEVKHIHKKETCNLRIAFVPEKVCMQRFTR